MVADPSNDPHVAPQVALLGQAQVVLADGRVVACDHQAPSRKEGVWAATSRAPPAPSAKSEFFSLGVAPTAGMLPAWK